MGWLYRTELKGIQGWILATDKLRELAGGSDGIEQLVDDVRILGNDRVISAAAGGLTLWFSDLAELEDFAAEWPFRVEQAVPGLNMVQAWIDLGERKQPCPDDWAAVRRGLARAGNRVTPEIPQAGPLVARAGRSGRPAVARGAEGSLLDRAMQRKEQRARKGARDRLEELLAEDGERFILDLDALGEGYLAVVHIDANSVGDRLQSNPDLNQKAFSQALADATRMAAREAIRKEVERRQVDGRSLALARPVVLGGDDFTVVCRGEDGLRLTEAYLEQFEDATRQAAGDLGGAGLRACAGVALARPAWPFVYAHRLAEELCRAAKDHCKKQDASGLAFHRVTSSLVADWEGIRGGELSYRYTPALRGGPEKRVDVLTANPYTLERWRLLGIAAEQAADLARGALRRWVALAVSDPEAAGRHWQRLREVAREGGAWAGFAEALRGLEVDPETGWEVEVRTRDDGCEVRRTPVADLVERLAVRRAGARGGR